MQSQSTWLRTDRAFPFSAIVGQDKAKLALIVSIVDPEIGGALLTGPKGAGKSLIVNSLERILPEIDAVDGCQYNCSSRDRANLCQECRSRLQRGEELPSEKKRMRIVRLPVGATEDRVLGGVDLEKAVSLGLVALQPGLLAEANRNILYVDQINLLSEHLVDSMLDAAASGWTRVEREGLSASYPSRFILIGSMNPEEGELRPQIMDRFSLQASVLTEENFELRTAILERNMDFDQDFSSVIESYGKEDEQIAEALVKARDRLQSVSIPEEVRRAIAKTCSELRVDGHRPDIVTLRTARAIAAYAGRLEVSTEDIVLAAEFSLVHRPRGLGTLGPPSTGEIQASLHRALLKGAERPAVPSKPPEGAREVTTGLRAPQMALRPMKKLSRREFLMKLMLAVAVPLLNFVLAVTLVAFLLLSMQGFLGVPFPQAIEIFWIHYWIAVTGVFLLLMAFLYRKRETLYIADVQTKQLSRLLVDKQIIADELFPGVPFDFLEGTPPTYTIVPLEVEVKVPKIVAFLEKGSKTLSNLFKPSREGFTKKEFVPVLERRVRPLRRYVLGKHSKTETTGQAGRYVSYEIPRRGYRDIAFGPTIRAAAIRPEPTRKSRLRVQIKSSDLRVKIREHKVPLSILLVLDMSESMVSSLDNVGKAILSLHRTASRKRDRVGLVVFKGSEAVLLQHLTRNLRQVATKLLDLGASDFTPLAAGIMKALRVLRVETARNRDCIPLIVVITDGIVNVPLSQPLSFSTRNDFMNSAQADVVDVARLIAREGIRTLIINTDHREEILQSDLPGKRKSLSPTALLIEVAKITKGRYYGLTMEEAYGSPQPLPKEEATILARPLTRYWAKRSAGAVQD